MMPEMDGFKVVRKIQGDRHLHATPVVLITAYDEPFVERIGSWARMTLSVSHLIIRN